MLRSTSSDWAHVSPDLVFSFGGFIWVCMSSAHAVRKCWMMLKLGQLTLPFHAGLSLLLMFPGVCAGEEERHLQLCRLREPRVSVNSQV